ncbi:BA14K family protein [Brucella haematophila]|jgi:BA14K-like protein|uniref:Lectin-like protein BA14k n=1 Tax=Brucella haematophila TaxID=419474 RepID=A0ABX1DI05_9HYPH|nr:BA14K family protein [Brucella haematophila]KAB2699623.1 BA14K family protein [Ochrobactrum sp. Kaboul]NKC02609.1 BA14K family protein [Brucella haematophila]TMU96404.1 BA14K family protein [Brucella haematophila]
MLKKALCAAMISSLFAVGFAAPTMAVELRKTPYLPSLQPARPPIVNPNSNTNRPGPNSPGCYGSVTCRNSESYISGEGVLRYKNGEPLEVRPSTRPQVQRFGPSVNHMQWCSNRYRSYRSSDDTYQPLAGPRTSCNSPFQ